MCTQVHVPEEASKGVSSPGAGVAGNCKLPSKAFGTPTVVCWKNSKCFSLLSWDAKCYIIRHNYFIYTCIGIYVYTYKYLKS